MTWDVVALHSGPWLHNGDEAIMGAIAFFPVIALALFFLFTVGRNHAPRRQQSPTGPEARPTDTPGRPGSPS